MVLYQYDHRILCSEFYVLLLDQLIDKLCYRIFFLLQKHHRRSVGQNLELNKNDRKKLRFLFRSIKLTLNVIIFFVSRKLIIYVLQLYAAHIIFNRYLPVSSELRILQRFFAVSGSELNLNTGKLSFIPIFR